MSSGEDKAIVSMRQIRLTVFVPVHSRTDDAMVLLPQLPDQLSSMAGPDLLQPLLYGILSCLHTHLVLLDVQLMSAIWNSSVGIAKPDELSEAPLTWQLAI